jgi:hypothetical protein
LKYVSYHKNSTEKSKCPGQRAGSALSGLPSLVGRKRDFRPWVCRLRRVRYHPGTRDTTHLAIVKPGTPIAKRSKVLRHRVSPLRWRLDPRDHYDPDQWPPRFIPGPTSREAAPCGQSGRCKSDLRALPTLAVPRKRPAPSAFSPPLSHRGPRVRILLPPAVSLLQTAIETISASSGGIPERMPSSYRRPPRPLSFLPSGKRKR